MKDVMKEAIYHAGYGNVVINESLWKKLPELPPPSIPTNFKDIQRQPMTARNSYQFRYMPPLPRGHMKDWQRRFCIGPKGQPVYQPYKPSLPTYPQKPSKVQRIFVLDSELINDQFQSPDHVHYMPPDHYIHAQWRIHVSWTLDAKHDLFETKL